MTNYIIEIAVSVTLAFFLFCITPFFAKLRNKMIKVFESISKSYSNSIYKKASFSSVIGSLPILIQTIILAIFMSISFFYGQTYATYNTDSKELLSKRVNNVLENNNSKLNSENFEEELYKLLNEDIKRSQKSTTLLLGGIILGFIVFTLIRWSKAEFINILIISFNRELNIIRPKLTDIDYHKIKSDWASMENKGDWESVNVFIEKKKKEINKNA